MYQTNERCEKCGQRLHANGKKFVCLHCAAPTAQVEDSTVESSSVADGIAVAETIAEAIPVPDTPEEPQ